MLSPRGTNFRWPLHLFCLFGLWTASNTRPLCASGDIKIDGKNNGARQFGCSWASIVLCSPTDCRSIYPHFWKPVSVQEIYSVCVLTARHHFHFLYDLYHQVLRTLHGMLRNLSRTMQEAYNPMTKILFSANGNIAHDVCMTNLAGVEMGKFLNCFKMC